MEAEKITKNKKEDNISKSMEFVEEFQLGKFSNTDLAEIKNLRITEIRYDTIGQEEEYTYNVR